MTSSDLKILVTADYMEAEKKIFFMYMKNENSSAIKSKMDISAVENQVDRVCEWFSMIGTQQWQNNFQVSNMLGLSLFSRKFTKNLVSGLLCWKNILANSESLYLFFWVQIIVLFIFFLWLYWEWLNPGNISAIFCFFLIPRAR